MSDRNQILNDPETAMRYALLSLQKQMWTALPAIVNSVDLTKMTLECTPSVKGVLTDENGVQTYVQLPLLVDVPICFPSAGGFSLTLPIAQGDEVLAIISSRCIDAWWQSGGIQNPIELRMHDLSDAFAIPGPRSVPRVVSSISGVNAQLRTDDGSCFLEITPDGKMNMTAPGGVTIVGDLEVTGDITADSALNVIGALTAATVTSGGIGLATHKHTGVTTGSGTSGGPTP